MDPARFDSLTRSAANRREVVSKLGVGGLAAALTAGLGVRRASAQTVACSLDLRAFVRLGPSAGVPLTPAATQAGSVVGTLQMTITSDGSLESATFVLADGTSLPVTGQAIGQQLAVRVALDESRTLVFQGVAQQPLRICEGLIDGSLIGPTEGDLGDWHGVAMLQNPRGTTDNATSVSESIVTATNVSATSSPSPTPPMPTPSATAECLPLGSGELCFEGACGLYSDGCTGLVDCGACPAGQKCFLAGCCTLKPVAEVCTDINQCGNWDAGCGDVHDCGGCPEGFGCAGGYCCGNPGQGCSVGAECCSGSCSMLNGCN